MIFIFKNSERPAAAAIAHGAGGAKVHQEGRQASVDLPQHMRQELISSAKRRQQNKSALYRLNQKVKGPSAVEEASGHQQLNHVFRADQEQCQQLFGPGRYGEDIQAYAGTAEPVDDLAAAAGQDWHPEPSPATYDASDALPKVMTNNLNS